MTVNKPLVLATLDLIEANLDRWDQDQFVDASESCGTTLCFGGWGLVQSGYAVVRGEFRDRQGLPVHPHDIEGEAREVFGFTYPQSEEIFYWFPEDRLQGYLEGMSRQDEFDRFKEHVLATLGMGEGR